MRRGGSHCAGGASGDPTVDRVPCRSRETPVRRCKDRPGFDTLGVLTVLQAERGEVAKAEDLFGLARSLTGAPRPAHRAPMTSWPTASPASPPRRGSRPKTPHGEGH